MRLDRWRAVGSVRVWAAGLLLLVAVVVGLGRIDPPAEETASAATPTIGPTATPTTPTASALPTASASPTAIPPVEAVSADATVSPVPAEQWRKMKAAGMAYRGCPVTRADLRRVQVNHVTFAGTVRRGTLVVHRDVAASTARIFTRLFDERYPIARMRPVEEYGGDDNASMRANNTSAYNCRHPDQINAPQAASPHANGRAIDVNPLQNPWMDPRCRCWVPSAEFAKRTQTDGVVRRGGLVWRLFVAEGWIWQNIDVPDYMHFDTGYPSRPFRDRKATDESTPSSDGR
ncbi:MAG: M15 family metallopeptidase [Sporichthyaceae bacterium]